jgi:hypothetical protein
MNLRAKKLSPLLDVYEFFLYVEFHHEMWLYVIRSFILFALGQVAWGQLEELMPFALDHEIVPEEQGW